MSDSDNENMSEIDFQKCRIPDLEKALSQLRTESRLSGLPDTQDSAQAMTIINHSTPDSAAVGGEARHEVSFGKASQSKHDAHAITIFQQNNPLDLSEDSFAGRIGQLANATISRPTLLKDIAKSPTAAAAAQAICEAANGIQSRLSLTWDVIRQAGCEDDLDWALQAGRPSLDSIDSLLNRYKSFASELTTAVENFNLREEFESHTKQNVVTSPSEKATGLFENQVKRAQQNWAQLCAALKSVKEKIELALEWDELWHTVVGDIEAETDALTDLVFVMEERRHAWLSHSSVSAQNGEEMAIDFDSLEYKTHRLSVPSPYPNASGVTQPQPIPANDSNLLALFARLQPLRASLDFLPFRLTVFLERAKSIFPSACALLEARAQGVEERWARLHLDTEALKKEVGEDRYLVAFRSAFKQARQLAQSIDRGISKLMESIGSEMQKSNPTFYRDRLSDYQSKKEHYVPSILKVMSIMKDAMKDRASVSREVKNLDAEIEKVWLRINTKIQQTDKAVDEVYVNTKGISTNTNDVLNVKPPVRDSRNGAATPSSSLSPMDCSKFTDKLSEPLTPATTVDTEDGSLKHPTPGHTSPKFCVPRPTTITPTGTAYYSRIPRPTPNSRALTSDASAPSSRKLSLDSDVSVPSVAAITNHSIPSLRKFSSTSSNRRPSLSSSEGGSSIRHSGPTSGPKPRWAYSFNPRGLKVGNQLRSSGLTTPSPYHKYNIPQLGTPTAARSSSSLAGGSPSAVRHPLTAANLERGRVGSPALISPPFMIEESAVGASLASRRPSYAHLHSYSHTTRPGPGPLTPRSSFGTEIQRPIMLKKRASAAHLGGGSDYFGANRSVSQVREREAALFAGRPSTSMGRHSNFKAGPATSSLTSGPAFSPASSWMARSRRYSNSNGIGNGRNKRASLIPLPSPPAVQSPPAIELDMPVQTPPSMLASRRLTSRASSFLGEKPKWR
ncbi:KAR9-domain-containing protein [Xylona heveae TC161]|uniref:KAR9-domain-containing protein n=1 Tax=Xylona heveae (strain CBS 132557 / TC161) TaxID=1328760 RepID=A0A165I4Y0_XYLHT|nr:KAR9-domain-containing protein [Xylona heveae TC161]KZF24389.1 KAR9-domain-containing protein [Xylona heveae TC161]